VWQQVRARRAAQTTNQVLRDGAEVTGLHSAPLLGDILVLIVPLLLLSYTTKGGAFSFCCCSSCALAEQTIDCRAPASFCSVRYCPAAVFFVRPKYQRKGLTLS